MAQGSFILASQLYNVLGCFKADRDNKLHQWPLLRYSAVSSSTNSLNAVKATSYHRPVTVF